VHELVFIKVNVTTCTVKRLKSCWSYFNVNFNTPFKQFSCASFGDKTLISDNQLKALGYE
jgi:hypothetical protein